MSRAWLCCLALSLLTGCGDDFPGGGGAGGLGGGGAGGLGGGGAADALPRRGVLQFQVEHNMETDACVSAADCRLSIEAEDDVQAWLGRIAELGTMPVLHWDRAIPWMVFAEPAPDPGQRVAFYDGRLDANLRAWIDAFAAQFADADGGLLTVSPLHGDRVNLAPMHRANGSEEMLTDGCPTLAPGTTFDTSEGTFELGPTYAHFLLYLHDKLRPSRMALAVEANLYLLACPDQWDGFVETYRDAYDAVRAEVDAELPLFTTLIYSQLLGHDDQACHGGLAWVPCTEPAPDPPVVDAATCYPMDRKAIDDFEAGDRLDLLALSFYPDGLTMSFPGEESTLEAFLPASFEDGECVMHARMPALADPLAQLDRLGWEGPVAFAETSARGCPTYAWIDDGQNAFVVEAPGSLDRQTYWLDAVLTASDERAFDFVVWSFLEDYQPLGPWTVEQGVLDPLLLNIFNTWTCSGLLDGSGQEKPGLTQRWRDSLVP